MKITDNPLFSNQRRKISKFTPLRIWPICGGACTVAPHKYMDASPFFRGTKGWTARDNVSYNESELIGSVYLGK